MFNSTIFKKKQIYAQKTFTFYIPSPPFRKNGYRETEFDSIIEKIITAGFEIDSINTQSHSSEEKSGMWVICLLNAPNKKVFETKIDFEASESDSNESISIDPSIIHDF